MRYSVDITRLAAKQLSKISMPNKKRIADAIDGLANDPFGTGTKKLKGYDTLWRKRVGDYRILYDIQNERLVVTVVTVAHRKQAYR